MTKDENGNYVASVQGHTEKTLAFRPGVSVCGNIRDGVSFANGNEGGWVISFEDLEEMYILAVMKRREVKAARKKK